jgi:DNA-binding NtrC family response regulator
MKKRLIRRFGAGSISGFPNGRGHKMDTLTRKLANTSHTVLITGRTGTGISHLAKQIHEASHRCEMRFVTINLATLSESLIESELFGHEKGAFSGADARRIGKLESANGGTVFLDEIGELPLRLQTKLLEALNSHTISPVGSNREIALNGRIIVATNRDLKKMVKSGEFREDLYFRINTFQIELPSLSSAPEKIPYLASDFAALAAERQGKDFFGMSPTFLDTLKQYPWPGNVRELKNCLEFAVAMSPDGTLTPECLPPYVHAGQAESGLDPVLLAYPTDYRQAKSHFERSYLKEILGRFEGKINLTARETGLSKVTLIDKIRRYEIDVKRIKYSTYTQEKI